MRILIMLSLALSQAASLPSKATDQAPAGKDWKQNKPAGAALHHDPAGRHGAGDASRVSGRIPRPEMATVVDPATGLLETGTTCGLPNLWDDTCDLGMTTSRVVCSNQLDNLMEQGDFFPGNSSSWGSYMQGPEAWYQLTVSEAVLMDMHTCHEFGTDFDTCIALFAVSADSLDAVLLCDDWYGCTDPGEGSLNSRLLTVLQPGEYFAAVGAYGGDCGSYTVSFDFVNDIVPPRLGIQYENGIADLSWPLVPGATAYHVHSGPAYTDPQDWTLLDSTPRNRAGYQVVAEDIRMYRVTATIASPAVE